MSDIEWITRNLKTMLELEPNKALEAITQLVSTIGEELGL